MTTQSIASGTVIVHDEMGVYLGSCMGLGFWTLLDPAGQPSACTFESEAQARAHVATWDEQNDPDAYRYVPAGGDRFATIPQLEAAGLGHLLGGMKEDALRYCEPEGHA